MTALTDAINLTADQIGWPTIPNAFAEVKAALDQGVAQYLNDEMVWNAATAAISADRQLVPGDLGTVQVVKASAADLSVLLPDATDGDIVVGRPVVIVNPAAVDEVQTLTVTGGPTGGTFRLTFSGQETANITYSVTAETTRANIQAALLALSNIDSVVVTSEGGGVFAVAWTGTDGATSHPLLVLSSNALSGGSSPNIAIAERWDGVAAGENYQIKDFAGRVLIDALLPGQQATFRCSGTATAGGVWQRLEPVSAGRLLHTTIITSSPAALEWTRPEWFNGRWRRLELRLMNVSLGNDGVHLALLWRVLGAYLVSAYESSGLTGNSGTTTVTGVGSTGTQVTVNGGASSIGNAGDEAVSASIVFDAPGVPGLDKTCDVFARWRNTNSVLTWYRGVARNSATTPIDGFKLQPSAGVLSGGIVQLWGYP